MITRNDYLANSEKLHHDYYTQFATDDLKRAVVQHIGLDMIQASTDVHFNDIPLPRWDAMYPIFEMSANKDAMKAAGESMTLSTSVCVLKAIARELKEGD